ncbi:MAG: hypothetical protein AB1556_17220 [Bacillota bacterium]
MGKKRVTVGFMVCLCVLGLAMAGCGSAPKRTESPAGGSVTVEKENPGATARPSGEVAKVDTGNVAAQVEAERAKKARKLEAYLESVGPILAQMQRLAGEWDGLRQQSATGQISDVEFGVRVLEYFMPRTNSLAESAETLSVGIDREFAEVHEELIKGLNLNLQAFSEIVAAIDNGDYSKITSANRLLSEARAAERRYVQRLEALAAEYGIRFQGQPGT